MLLRGMRVDINHVHPHISSKNRYKQVGLGYYTFYEDNLVFENNAVRKNLPNKLLHLYNLKEYMNVGFTSIYPK